MNFDSNKLNIIHKWTRQYVPSKYKYVLNSKTYKLNMYNIEKKRHWLLTIKELF